MEEYDYAFYEEPCRSTTWRTPRRSPMRCATGRRGRAGVERGPLPLDDRQPGGRRLQPDLHYYGGFIRSMRVARMAHAAACLHAAHVGLGSRLPRRGELRRVHPQSRPIHGVQGDSEIPVSSDTSSLKSRTGRSACRRERDSGSPSTPPSSARQSRLRRSEIGRSARAQPDGTLGRRLGAAHDDRRRDAEHHDATIADVIA